jgi:UDP-N-acetylmuramoyl-L-alanyl-D-glutamate--2,6-diaminopimelate ligase
LGIVMAAETVTLRRVVAADPAARADGDLDRPLRAVCTDSRTAQPGSLFVAIRGMRTDGHLFIGEAVRAGAVAVAYERPTAAASLPPRIARVHAPDTRRFAALAAAVFYGRPSDSLCLVGVTGTNGKTTVTHLLYAIFRAAGHEAGILGTLGHRLGSEVAPGERTTPDSVDLQDLLRRMVDAGVTHAAMEVSSHGLALRRPLGCSFDAAVLTNVTQDHLDFHPSAEDYLQAKMLLFTEYADAARPRKELQGIINADDPSAERVRQVARCRLTSYGVEQPAEVRAEAVQTGREGLQFDLVGRFGRRPLRLRLCGSFNVYNALAAAASGVALGYEVDLVAEALSAAPPVPGRFEYVDEGQPFAVVVDYAHTPDGLANVLRAAREIATGRVICVFGCGGDRDKSKRPLMGAVAGGLADLAIVTSDNPRSEDPEAIIADIVPGLNGAAHVVEADREQAIRRGLELCRPGDVLLIAGKGHETCQIFRDRTIEFDDRAVAARILRELRA